MRLAVVGAGAMGARLAEAVHARDDSVVTVVIDPDLDRAGALAGRLGAAAFADLPAALAGADVDAVYIGSPNDTHAELCLQAAAAGLDILVDKPMALTLVEADAIQAAVQRSGVHLMVGFSYRYRAEWRQARQWLGEGLLGRVHLVADTLVESAEATPSWYWRRARGGGVIQLQSHHCFDRTAWLLREAVQVTGCVTRSPQDGSVGSGDGVGADAETAAVVAGTSASGVPLSFSIAFAPGHSAPSYAVTVIQGSEGTLVIDSVARRATLSGTAGRDAVYDAQGDDWLAREVDAFCRLRAGDASAPGWAEGRAAVECAGSALRAARQPDECQNWRESGPGAVDEEGRGWKTSRM